MRFLLVLAMFGGWSLLGLLNPAYACGLLLFVDIAAPLELAYSTGAFPISMLSLVAMLGSFAVNVGARGFRPRPNFFTWMWAAFMGWCLVCTLRSPFPATSEEGMVDILKYLGPLLLVSMSARTVKDARFLALVLAAAMGIWGSQIGLGCLKNGVNRFMHIAGTQMGDNNFLSAAVVAILPMLIYAASDYEGRFKKAVRLGWIAAFLLCMSTVVFSDSRGAALGVIGNVLIYLVFISKRKVRDVSVALALGVVVVLILPQSFWDRMNTLQAVGTEEAEGSAKERLLLLQSTFRAVQDHPVFGVGPYSWVEVSTSYTGLEIAMQPHNIWLKCAVELGYPGLLLFLGLIVGTIVRLLRVRNRALKLGQARTAKLALALAASQIGYIVSLTFLSNYDLEFQWAWLAVGNAFVSAWKANPSGAGARRARKGGAPRPAPVAAPAPEPSVAPASDAADAANAAV